MDSKDYFLYTIAYTLVDFRRCFSNNRMPIIAQPRVVMTLAQIHIIILPCILIMHRHSQASMFANQLNSIQTRIWLRGMFLSFRQRHEPLIFDSLWIEWTSLDYLVVLVLEVWFVEYCGFWWGAYVREGVP